MLGRTDTHTLRIPQVYYYGCLSSNPAGGTSIIMEHLDFSSGSDQAALGTQLARMHLADAKVRCSRWWGADAAQAVCTVMHAFEAVGPATEHKGQWGAKGTVKCILFRLLSRWCVYQTGMFMLYACHRTLTPPADSSASRSTTPLAARRRLMAGWTAG